MGKVYKATLHSPSEPQELWGCGMFPCKCLILLRNNGFTVLQRTFWRESRPRRCQVSGARFQVPGGGGWLPVSGSDTRGGGGKAAALELSARIVDYVIHYTAVMSRFAFVYPTGVWVKDFFFN